MHELLGRRMKYVPRDGEHFFDAAKNARIVHAAEQYYRIMYHGSRDSWNLGDRHMFDTLHPLFIIATLEAKALV